MNESLLKTKMELLDSLEKHVQNFRFFVSSKNIKESDFIHGHQIIDALIKINNALKRIYTGAKGKLDEEIKLLGIIDMDFMSIRSAWRSSSLEFNQYGILETHFGILKRKVKTNIELFLKQ